jgi:hypothetical protein
MLGIQDIRTASALEDIKWTEICCGSYRATHIKWRIQENYTFFQEIEKRINTCQRKLLITDSKIYAASVEFENDIITIFAPVCGDEKLIHVIRGLVNFFS